MRVWWWWRQSLDVVLSVRCCDREGCLAHDDDGRKREEKKGMIEERQMNGSDMVRNRRKKVKGMAGKSKMEGKVMNGETKGRKGNG